LQYNATILDSAIELPHASTVLSVLFKITLKAILLSRILFSHGITDCSGKVFNDTSFIQNVFNLALIAIETKINNQWI